MLSVNPTSLRNCPIFASMDTSTLKLLVFTSTHKRFEADEVLYSQGDSGDAAYLIIEGQANVFVDADGGEYRPILVATLGQYELIGETSILCNTPRTATVKAISGLSVLKISKEVFLQILNDSPLVGIEIIRVLATRLEHASNELVQLKYKLQGAKNQSTL